MTPDYLQNIRNRMRKEAKGYPTTQSVQTVMANPPASRDVGTFTGARSGMAPAPAPTISIQSADPPGSKVLGIGNRDVTTNSPGRDIVRSALAGGLAGGPTGAIVGAIAEGGRQLLQRFGGGRRRAADFSGQYGNRFQGTIPGVDDRMPMPGMQMPGRPYSPPGARYNGPPASSAGATPGSEVGPEPAYTVPSYSGGGSGSGAAPTVPGTAPAVPGGPRSTRFASAYRLNAAREGMNALRDQAALDAMKLHQYGNRQR